MDDNWILAGRLKAAGTPGSLREIYKKLQNAPAGKPANFTAATPAPSGPVRYTSTEFYREVEKLMDRGLSYTDAYKRTRRDFPELFDAMLDAVNA